jgi:hypothetical protein
MRSKALGQEPVAATWGVHQLEGHIGLCIQHSAVMATHPVPLPAFVFTCAFLLPARSGLCCSFWVCSKDQVPHKKAS